MTNSRWHNQTAFITGASSGIGRALAIELARRGCAAVTLIARRRELIDEAAREVESFGAKALAIVCDVKDESAMREAAQATLARFGKIDLAVANAGVAVITPAANIDAKQVKEVFAINVLGAVNMVAAVLPSMLENRSGQLVAISSLAAFRGLPASSAYSSSKAALSTYFESLRLDLKTRGIDVTTIHPGFIRTPMTAQRKSKLPFLMELEEATGEIIRAIEARQPTHAFPWQLAAILGFARLLPAALYDPLARRLIRRA